VVANIWMLWSVAAVLVASGCGGSGSRSPEQKCDDLVDTVCERLANCLNVPSQKADCIRGAGQSLSCSAAKSVTDGYDTCMDDLDDASCDALLDTDDNGDPEVTLPASCRAVILIGREGPPSTSFAGIRDAAHLIGP
jgi:hypothetical protein